MAKYDDALDHYRFGQPLDFGTIPGGRLRAGSPPQPPPGWCNLVGAEMPHGPCSGHGGGNEAELAAQHPPAGSKRRDVPAIKFSWRK